MRAHVDFIEYTPFVLIPTALREYAGRSRTSLRGLGAAYAAGRIRYLRGFVLAVARPAAG
ncbi:MAPEG family protein [Paraburkholderia sp. SARCC-3016]|uniref:MAPEG family protein n=1 Tax=Paraburkholderia sp. SARCC-3016 TaxID=3058611 RepID=UPI0035BE32EE